MQTSFNNAKRSEEHNVSHQSVAEEVPEEQERGGPAGEEGGEEEDEDSWGQGGQGGTISLAGSNI